MVQMKKKQQKINVKKKQKTTVKKQQKTPNVKKQQKTPDVKKQQQQKLLPKVEDEFRRFPFFKVSGVILLLCLIGLIVFLIVENRTELGFENVFKKLETYSYRTV